MDDSHSKESPLKITSQALVRIIRAKDKKAASLFPQRDPALDVPPQTSLSKKPPKIPVEELAGRVKKSPKGRFVTSGKLDDVAPVDRGERVLKGAGRIEHKALYKSGRLASLEPMKPKRSPSSESGLGNVSGGRRTTFGRGKADSPRVGGAKTFEAKPFKFGDFKAPKSLGGPSNPRSASSTRESRPFGGVIGGASDRRPSSGAVGFGKSKGCFGGNKSFSSNRGDRPCGKKGNFPQRHPKFGGNNRGGMKP